MTNANYKSSSSDLFEQYKLYVESAERNSDRRAVANRFMVAMNSIVFSAFLYGILYFVKSGQGISDSPIFLLVIFVFCTMGAMFSLWWKKMIDSYASLNKAKFDVIEKLECQMPVAVYKHEWEIAKSNKHQDITKWERCVTTTLMALYIIVFLFIAGWYCKDYLFLVITNP